MIIKRGQTWHLRLQFDGTLYQKSLRTQNKAEAIKLEAAFRTSLVRGEFGIIDGQQAPTLKDFGPRLLAHLKSATAPRTYQFYKENLEALNNFEPLANAKLSKIDSALIERFTQWRLNPDGKARTPVTVNHSLRTLKRALRLGKEWKLLRDVPKIKLLPGEHQREHVLNEAQLAAMVSYIEAAYPTSIMHYLLPFLVDTGLRISEACNLRYEDCDFNSKPATVRVTKGKSKFAKREIPLTDRALKNLKEATKRSRSGWVFTSKGGRKPMTRHYPSEQFRLIRETLGLPEDCVLHSTRHTFCTRLGMGGASAFTIQKLAGHSSIMISQRYVHADREANRAAIQLLNALNNPPAVEPSDEVEEI